MQAFLCLSTISCYLLTELTEIEKQFPYSDQERKEEPQNKAKSTFAGSCLQVNV